MGAWSDLPNEIATMILHSLDSLDRFRNPQKHIMRCTYVSHQFRSITEPILYREVKLALADEDEDDPFRQLRQLTRTVVSRPQIGKLIQALEIPSLPSGLYDSDPEGINSSHSPKNVEKILRADTTEVRADLRILLDAATHLELPNGLILQGGLIGELFLLLHHLPRLQKLNIKINNDVRMFASSALGDLPGGIPAGLQSVSELSICHDDPETGFSTRDVMPLMILPSLTSFTVSSFAGEEGYEEGLRIGGLDDSESSVADANTEKEREPSDSRLTKHGRSLGAIRTSSGYSLPTQSSPATTLDLVMSGVSGTLLSRILTLPAALECFRYEIDWRVPVDATFIPSQFLPGLLAQADSLKELVINTKQAQDFPEDNPPIDSLAGLRVLERLVVPTGMLLKHDSTVVATQNPLDILLPPSLITLELDLDEWQWGTLSRLLTVTGIPQTLPTTARRIPTLRRIIISHQDGGLDTFRIEDEAIAEGSRICPQITLEFRSRYTE